MTTYPNPPMTPPAPSRPLGVAILAVLIGIFAFLFILAGSLILVGVAAFAFLNAGSLPGIVGVTGVAAGAIVLIIGLIILGVALGLYHLRMWALVLALLVLIVVIVTDGIAHNFSWGFIVGILLFVYLLAVSRHFR
jgi:hypothetical protein